jgi:hypothetical protein
MVKGTKALHLDFSWETRVNVNEWIMAKIIFDISVNGRQGLCPRFVKRPFCQAEAGLNVPMEIIRQ